MKEYNVIYLPYLLNKGINYIFILRLYGIAKREDKAGAGIKSIIEYTTLKDLCMQLNNDFSSATISRILDKPLYKDFFTIEVSPAGKRIILNNNFTKFKGGKGLSFVRLIPSIYNYLLSEKDNLLCMYVIYILWACGVGKGKSDFTAEQFLSVCGYSIKGNSYKEKLCAYNSELVQLGYITIDKWIDKGRYRNTYTVAIW